MAGHNSFDNLTNGFSEERLEKIENIKEHLRLEMTLAELRQQQGFSQKELGEHLGVQQPAVARMENRNDIYVSSLRSLIKALGGELVLVAKFPDKEIQLTGLKDSS